MKNINEITKTLSDEELINHFISYRNGNEVEEEVVLRHNKRLVLFIISKYFASCNDSEELFQIGLIGLSKSIRTFDITKNIKFSTYASKVIINEINRYLEKENKIKNEISLSSNVFGLDDITLEDTLEDETQTIVENYEEKELKEFILKSLDILTLIEKLVIENRFGFNNKEILTQTEIGKMLGCSQTYVLKVERKALKKLKEELIKNNYYEINRSFKLVK